MNKNKGKIKVLYLVSTLKSGGPTNQLYSIIHNLDRNVFEPIIITLSPVNNEKVLNKFSSMDVKIIILKYNRLQMQLYGRRTLAKLLNEISPDIIHTTGIRPDCYIQKWNNSYLHLSTIRNYAFDDYTAKFGKIKGYCMAKKHIDCISKIGYPISCSYAIKNRLFKNHLIKSKVIQNGIDLSRFVINKEKIMIRKKLNLPIEKTVFLFVGALVELKNPTYLVDAFNNAKLHGKAVLVILGAGVLLERLKINCNSDVIFRGHVDNIEDYFAAADYFVSPSKSEGLPNVVLEALASGLRVLLSDIEPHKEIINGEKNAGDLFSLSNLEELTILLKKHTNGFNNGFNLNSRRLVEQRFSSEKMSKQYQDFYKEIHTESRRIF